MGKGPQLKRTDILFLDCRGHQRGYFLYGFVTGQSGVVVGFFSLFCLLPFELCVIKQKWLRKGGHTNSRIPNTKNRIEYGVKSWCPQSDMKT